MLSKKPYLLRAMHQWIVDNGHTPHIVADAGIEGLQSLRVYAQEGKLILNISYEATQQLEIAAEYVEFSARFSGASRLVRVPMDAVLAVYAFETGQGMIFEPLDTPASRQAPGENPQTTSSIHSGNAGKPDLKIVK
ncbi:MAG: ClpXP protease specificity-enhancing factor [Gammaproteobacteria bacterium]|nr:ClpXP protease specificity-enhancing factor [Gammaproteobacteria bacterium]MDE2344852.1 ClpXP protease specificity-enhancing factor [Gammaproteobacteria bacterium]